VCNLLKTFREKKNICKTKDFLYPIRYMAVPFFTLHVIQHIDMIPVADL